MLTDELMMAFCPSSRYNEWITSLVIAKAFFQITGHFCGSQLDNEIQVGESSFSLHEMKTKTDLVFLSPYRFALPDEVDIDGVSYEDLLPADEEPAEKKRKALKKRRELLKSVNFSK